MDFEFNKGVIELTKLVLIGEYIETLTIQLDIYEIQLALY